MSSQIAQLMAVAWAATGLQRLGSGAELSGPVEPWWEGSKGNGL